MGLQFTFIPASGIIASTAAFVMTSLELPPVPTAKHQPIPLNINDLEKMNVHLDSPYPGITYLFSPSPLATEAPAPLGLDDALLQNISGDLPRLAQPLTEFELEKPFIAIELLN